MFTLKIDTGNAAFEDAPFEIARILRRLAETVERSRGPDHAQDRVYDSNGNACGKWEWNN